MTEVRDQAAWDKIIKARTILVVTQPFFGCLSLHVELAEVPSLEWWKQHTGNDSPTMCVDGFTMHYWPEFVHSMKEKEILGVVAHEIMHCVYRHMTRRGNRHPVVYNFAGDYRINWDLKEAGFELPGDAIAWNPKADPKKDQKKGHLLDQRFKDMSTDEIYEIIYREIPKQKMEVMCGQGLDGMGACGAVIDAQGNGKEGKDKASGAAAAQKAEQEWEANVRIAVQAAQKNAGKLPGYLERLVENLQAPRVSWREMTRQFIDNSMIKDHSWQRPNRRFAGSGLYLPGMISDALHKLVMLVDVSGSVSEEMMHEFVSEIGGALDEGTADEIVVIYVDTDVRAVDRFVHGDIVKARVVAGGGTDFKTAMDYVAKEHSDAQVGVFLTDMCTNSFGEDPGFPWLWGAYCPKATLQHYNPPYGSVVQVSTGD